LDQEQVAEREQSEQLGPVFGEAPVAGLYVAELALENPERVFDLGAHHGDDPIELLVDGIELAALGCLAHHAPDVAVLGERGLAFRADLALVGPDRRLIAMQELISDVAVMDLRRRRFQAMDRTAIHIDGNVRLHAKVPVVALLC
jgi:hypothetical protein